MSGEGAVVVHVGACGSGKTYRLRARVAAAARSGWPGTFVVADVKREWPRPEGTAELGPLCSGSRVEMARAHVPPVERTADDPQVIICRPRADEARDVERVRAWCDRLCLAALERRDCIVVIPEAYRYAREGERMAPGLETLSHEYRHHRCGIWLDCQSVPEVRKELLRRAGWWCIHGTGAHEDLRRFEAMGGKALVVAVLEAQKRNVQRGPGHHVWFRTANPFPPYEVRDPRGVVVTVAAHDRAATALDVGAVTASAGNGASGRGELDTRGHTQPRKR